MFRFGFAARAGIAAAAGGLVLGLSVVPAGSQVIEQSSLDVAGTATCEVVEGEYTWVVDYTATNTSTIGIPASAPAALGEIDIIFQQAVLNGGTPFNTDLVPDPVQVEETAAYTVELPGSTVGTLVLTVGWIDDNEDEGTEVVTLQLDDSCHAPATTTTGAPAVQAVTVTPAFTG